VLPASKRLEVHTRSFDNAVWQRRYDASSWSAWGSVGGKTYASPAASARLGTSIVDAFIRAWSSLGDAWFNGPRR
jgi:hypothetical protein